MSLILIPKADIEQAILGATDKGLMKKALGLFHINEELNPTGVAMMFFMYSPKLAPFFKEEGYTPVVSDMAYALIEDALRRLPGVDDVFKGIQAAVKEKSE